MPDSPYRRAARAAAEQARAAARQQARASQELRQRSKTGGTLPPAERLTLLHLGNDDGDQSIRVTPKARSRHAWVIGQSGKGKSRFMEYCARQDIRAGRGFCLIDPHGSKDDSIFVNLLHWIEKEGLHQRRIVHVIDPSTREFVTPLNPLAHNPGDDLYSIAMSLMGVFERVWRQEFRDYPTIETLLPAIFVFLMEHNLTLADAAHVFGTAQDEVGLRRFLLGRLENEDARIALQSVDELTDGRAGSRDYKNEMIGPLNRIAVFTREQSVKRIFGATHENFDYARAMNEGHIVLANLQHSRRSFSRRASDLVGAVLVREFFDAGQERGSERPFTLYIDECHRYLTRDIASLLDESRKFGPSMFLAHQRIEQVREVDENILDALRVNTDIKAVFGGISLDDAKTAADDIYKYDLNMPVPALVKPTVVDTRRIHLMAHGESTAKGTNESRSNSSSRGKGHTETAGTSANTTGGDSSGQNFGVTLVPTNSGDNADVIIETSGVLSSVMTGWSQSETRSVANSINVTNSEAVSLGSNTQRSTTTTRSEALAPVYQPLPSGVYDLSAVQYMAAHSIRFLEAQSFIFNHGLFTVKVNVPTVETPPHLLPTHELVRRYLSGSALPASEADNNIKKRRQQLLSELRDSVTKQYDNSFDISSQRDEDWREPAPTNATDDNVVPFPSRTSDPDDGDKSET